MSTSSFVVRDLDARPRPGQNVVLHLRGHELRGSVDSFLGDRLAIRPTSIALLIPLLPGARVTAHIMTGEGTLEAVLSLARVKDGLALFRLVGLPVMVQRRSCPRVVTRLAASLAWLAPRDGGPRRLVGRTQNLSMNGVLVRFPAPPDHLPDPRTPTLLQLDLPEGPVSLPVLALQAWESGARLRFLELDPETVTRLRTFIEPRLSRPI
jgi:hypothetical protein